MKIICVSGKARHGKDTTAKLLKEYLELADKKVLVTHYADLLKYICKNYFDWDGKKDEKGRQLLQYVGTDVVRKRKPDFWVDFVADILELFDDAWDYVIICDTRFPNEVSALKDRGLDVIHLRIDRINFDNGLTKEQKNHPSETALDNIIPDYRITNDNNLEELRCEAVKFASMCIGKEKYKDILEKLPKYIKGEVDSEECFSGVRGDTN